MKKIFCFTVFFLAFTWISFAGDDYYDRYIHDYYKYGNFWVDHPRYGPQYNRGVPAPWYLLSGSYKDKYLKERYKYWNRYYEHPLYGPQYNRGMEGVGSSEDIHPYYPMIPYEKEENFYDWYRRNPDAVKKWTDEEIEKYNREIDEAREREDMQED